MKVYRNLSHAGGKVSMIGIGAGSPHEAALQEIKGLSFFPLHHDHSSVYTVVQGRPALSWMVLQSGAET